MKNGYHSLVWVNERNDRDYVCFADDIDEDRLEIDVVFNIEEFSRCLDISKFVGDKHR